MHSCYVHTLGRHSVDKTDMLIKRSLDIQLSHSLIPLIISLGSFLNTNTPGTSMLLVLVRPTTAAVPDPGRLKILPSPESNPTSAGLPPSPSLPPFLSDVVQLIPWSSYTKMVYEDMPSVARTHWNVLTYSKIRHHDQK